MASSGTMRGLAAAERDLGNGFMIRRALPQAACRCIGPFVFFDQFGPTRFESGHGLDVRPHPHIGLATITYLFDGELVHRDSLGNAQVIRPGEVNWMVAGRGIVHSERTAESARAAPSSLAGIQSWIALPQKDEEGPPAFSHHGMADLPVQQGPGRKIRILAGRMFGEEARVPTFSSMGYADVELEHGAQVDFGSGFEQCAAYVASGSVEAGTDVFGPGSLILPRAREEFRMRARKASRVMLVGGEPLDGPRFLWWNFVASSRELLARAREAWRQGQGRAIPGDSREFIPLPEEPLPETLPAAVMTPAAAERTPL